MISQVKLTMLLLRPSLTSGVSCLALAVTLLLVADWAFVRQSGLHDFLYGSYGIVTALNEAPHGFRALLEAVLVHPFGREAKTFIFIFLIGVVVYVILELVGRLFSGAEHSWEELHTAPPAYRRRLQLEAWERVGFRTAVFVGWFIYGYLFVGLLLPFCISSSRFFVATFPQWPGSGYGIAALVLLWTGLHVHVIIMRFLALRPRLFGSADALLAMK